MQIETRMVKTVKVDKFGEWNYLEETRFEWDEKHVRVVRLCVIFGTTIFLYRIKLFTILGSLVV